MADQIDGQLPWGIDSKQLQPGSLKTISDSKLATFAIGQQKKSRFQKAREEKELKKKQEDEEAAKVYDQFVASFEVQEGSKAFIRGGKIQDNNDSDIVQGGKRGEVYKLETKQRGAGTEMERMLEEMKERDDERAKRPSSATSSRISNASMSESPSRSSGQNKDNHSFSSSLSLSSSQNTNLNYGKPSDKNKNIDDFLQELKNKHESPSNDYRTVPEIFTNTEPEKGSFDNGDPDTTNLYIGNLAPSITEELLYEVFGKFGPINSVKVMWPRTEEERLRKRNCGFVSYMNRRDAEDAKMELHDSTVEGYRMSVGWGKAVKLNATPFTLPSALASLVSKHTTTTPTITATSGVISATSINLSNNILAPGLPPSITGGSSGVGSSMGQDVGMGLGLGLGTIQPPSSHLEMNVNMNTVQSSTGTTTAGTVPATGGGRWDAGPKIEVEKEMAEGDLQVIVKPPEDEKLRAIIDLTAKFVAIDGDAFEQSLKLKEDGNVDFSFLNNVDSDMGIYYRWKTFAIVMGEEERWREKPFQMVVDGPFWIPPTNPEEERRSSRSSRRRSRSGSPTHSRSDRDRDRGQQSSRRSRSRERERDDHRRRSGSLERERESNRKVDGSSGTDRDRDRDRDRRPRSRSRSPDKNRDRGGKVQVSGGGGVVVDKYLGMTGAQIERMRAKERGNHRAYLSDDTYDEFEGMLQKLSVGRGSIVEAMGIALDNADCAEEVVGILKESLLVPTTPFPVKVARLYLLSDILHNSGCHVKNASNYRTHIQTALPDIFESFGLTLRSASGRMTARQITERVQGVLDVWSQWAVFPPLFLMGLEATLMRSEAEEMDIQHASSETVEGGELDALRKKAKFSGVSVTIESATELKAKLNYVAEYTRRKTAGGVMGSGDVTSTGTACMFISGAPSPWQSVVQDVYDDTDTADVDGIPLVSSNGRGHFVAVTTTTAGSDNIDVDGMPLDDYNDGVDVDVDGAPLDEDEDIDGAPLPDDMDMDMVGVPMGQEEEEMTTSRSTRRSLSKGEGGRHRSSSSSSSSSSSEDSDGSGPGPGRIIIDHSDIPLLPDNNSLTSKTSSSSSAAAAVRIQTQTQKQRPSSPPSPPVIDQEDRERRGRRRRTRSRSSSTSSSSSSSSPSPQRNRQRRNESTKKRTKYRSSSSSSASSRSRNNKSKSPPARSRSPRRRDRRSRGRSRCSDSDNGKRRRPPSANSERRR
eukprot:gene5425-10875_t